jgi:hypothetical protein
MLTVKISYDMATGKEQECQDYLINKLAPRFGTPSGEIHHAF